MALTLDDADLATMALPAEFAAIPISVGQLSAPLKICAVVRRKPDPVAGNLVVIRSMLDARVVQGCLVDSEMKIHEWLEIWIQEIGTFIRAAEGLSSRRESHTNDILDARWKSQFDSLREADPLGFYTTGWEAKSPEPLLLNMSSLQPVRFIDKETSLAWELCKDDELLRRRGLPEYRTTLHRYLYRAGGADGATFIPVTPNAPRGLPTQDLILPPDTVALNIDGGRIFVRRANPFKLEDAIDRLGGIEWTGVFNGKNPLRIGANLGGKSDSMSGSVWLYLDQNGRAGRFCEAFHLKVRLLLELIWSVRDFVERTQRPLLNISHKSFEVDLHGAGRALPALWTLSTRLIDGGNAISLKVPLPSAEATYYLPADRGASPYRPQAASRNPTGTGQYLLERVNSSSAGGATIIEGRFFTDVDLREVAPNDMIGLTWWFGQGRIGPLDLFAQLQDQSRKDKGILEFRAVGKGFSPEVIAAIKSAEGTKYPNVAFEILPFLSTPCDLYSLGVLATRIFLVVPDSRDSAPGLGTAKGEVAAFARSLQDEPVPVIAPNVNGVEYSREQVAALALRKRIENVFWRDKGFADSLGPQRLMDERLTTEAAFGLLPEELWWDLLAVILRMAPEVGKDSYCAHYGDAKPGGLHRVFDGAIADLQSLLIRSRSLILIDWNSNREIQQVIEKARTP